jgi:hypothetical protein
MSGFYIDRILGNIERPTIGEVIISLIQEKREAFIPLLATA